MGPSAAGQVVLVGLPCWNANWVPLSGLPSSAKRVLTSNSNLSPNMAIPVVPSLSWNTNPSL